MARRIFQTTAADRVHDDPYSKPATNGERRDNKHQHRSYRRNGIVYALFGWRAYKNPHRPQNPPLSFTPTTSAAPNILNTLHKKYFKPLSPPSIHHAGRRYPDGVHTLQSLSSLPSTHAPRLSGSFASLARKLVVLYPYLSPPQSAILSTPTTFVCVPSPTYSAPSPTHLPTASPTMTMTFLHDSTVPFWFALGLPSIIFLAASCCFISRTHAVDNQHADHKEYVSVSVESKTETTLHSQTYIFTLGLIVGLFIGLGIDSVPAPVILLTLTQIIINLATDAVLHYSEKLILSGWKSMMLVVHLRYHSRRAAWRIAHGIHRSQCYTVFRDISIRRVSRTCDQLAQVYVSRLRGIGSRFYSTDKYLRLAMNLISYIVGVYRCSPAVSSRAAGLLQLFRDSCNIVKNTCLVVSCLPFGAKFRLPSSISWNWTSLVLQPPPICLHVSLSSLIPSPLHPSSVLSLIFLHSRYIVHL